MRTAIVLCALLLLPACAWTGNTSDDIGSTRWLGKQAGKAMAKYCYASPAAREIVRGEVNEGMQETCPGCSVRGNCPGDSPQASTPMALTAE